MLLHLAIRTGFKPTPIYKRFVFRTSFDYIHGIRLHWNLLQELPTLARENTLFAGMNHEQGRALLVHNLQDAYDRTFTLSSGLSRLSRLPSRLEVYLEQLPSDAHQDSRPCMAVSLEDSICVRREFLHMGGPYEAHLALVPLRRVALGIVNLLSELIIESSLRQPWGGIVGAHSGPRANACCRTKPGSGARPRVWSDNTRPKAV